MQLPRLYPSLYPYPHQFQVPQLPTAPPYSPQVLSNNNPLTHHPNTFQVRNSTDLHASSFNYHPLDLSNSNQPHASLSNYLPLDLSNSNQPQASLSNYLPLDLSNSNQPQDSSPNYHQFDDAKVNQPQESNNSVKHAPPKSGVSLPTLRLKNPKMSVPKSSQAASPAHSQASKYHLLDDVNVNQLQTNNQHDSEENQVNSIQPAVLNQTANLVSPQSKVYTMLPIAEGS